MTPNKQRVLAVAARSGRIGCVVVENGDLIFWQGSQKEAASKEQAVKCLRDWIREFRPDVLVSENPDAAGDKYGEQIPILQGFAEAGQDLPIVNLVVRRERPFDNVYEEAAHLAQQFPDLKDMVPKKPPIWMNEPYRLVFFEALALVRDAGLLNPFPRSEKENGAGQ